MVGGGRECESRRAGATESERERGRERGAWQVAGRRAGTGREGGVRCLRSIASAVRFIRDAHDLGDVPRMIRGRPLPPAPTRVAPLPCDLFAARGRCCCGALRLRAEGLAE